MIPDSYITELRLKAVRELPWPILAAVLVEMTDEDYWCVLNTIVTRISERRLTA